MSPSLTPTATPSATARIVSLLVSIGIVLAVALVVLGVAACGGDNATYGPSYSTHMVIIGNHTYSCVFAVGGGVWCAP